MVWALKDELNPDGPEPRYPAHLQVGNLYCHERKGVRQIGRVITCLVCNVDNNTRSRNGDARFIRQHRRCGFRT